jgi:hypothetical protein
MLMVADLEDMERREQRHGCQLHSQTVSLAPILNSEK